MIEGKDLLSQIALGLREEYVSYAGSLPAGQDEVSHFQRLQCLLSPVIRDVHTITHLAGFSRRGSSWCGLPTG